MNAAAGEIFVPKLNQLTRAGGVVCAVDVNRRIDGDTFEATRPAGGVYAVRNRSVEYLEEMFTEQGCPGSSGESVAKLEAAGQRGSERERALGTRGPRERLVHAVGCRDVFEAPLLIDVDEARVSFGAAAADDFAGIGTFNGTDDGGAGLDDAGLFGGDFVDGVAKEILVVEIDGCDDGDRGRDDIGGVKAAAEADFVDGDVERARCECEKSHRGDALEKGGMGVKFSGGQERFDGIVEPGPECGEVVVGDFGTVDADAFVHALEVRRSVKAGAEAGSSEDRIQHCSRGAFAVGTGNVDARDRAMRVAEPGGESGDSFEAEFLNPGVTGRGELAAERE